MMKQYFYIEGHKSKSDYGEESTLILDDKRAYASEETATAKAREYFDQNEDISLVVISTGLKLGNRVGFKYLFRNKDGQLEEVDNWWSDGTCC
jgi:hypothetical protein